MLIILRSVSSRFLSRHLLSRVTTRFYSIYEPDYLDSLQPKVPLHEPLNIQIKGYDFAILENCQRHIHNIADSMDVEVEDGWATPPQHLQVQKFKPQSLVIEAEFKMTLYERNIQVVNLPSTVAPVLLEILKIALPEGVNMIVHDHDPNHEEIRYVPDRELLDLKSQLDILGGPLAKKK